MKRMLERMAIVGFGGLEPERHRGELCFCLRAVGWARAVVLASTP